MYTMYIKIFEPLEKYRNIRCIPYDIPNTFTIIIIRYAGKGFNRNELATDEFGKLGCE